MHKEDLLTWESWAFTLTQSVVLAARLVRFPARRKTIWGRVFFSAGQILPPRRISICHVMIYMRMIRRYITPEPVTIAGNLHVWKSVRPAPCIRTRMKRPGRTVTSVLAVDFVFGAALMERRYFAIKADDHLSAALVHSSGTRAGSRYA